MRQRRRYVRRVKNEWTHPVTHETYRTTCRKRSGHEPHPRHRLIAVDGAKPPDGYIGELYSRIPRVIEDETPDD